MTSICVEDRYPECSHDEDDGVVEFNLDDEQFEVGIDATHFGPEEIRMSVNGRVIELIFETRLKLDMAGCVARREERKYELPEYVDPESITGKLIHRTFYVRGRIIPLQNQ